MTAGQAQRALGLAALACFCLLSYFNLRFLSPEGLAMLDTRILGYDLNAVRAYVGALGPVERAIYTGPFRVIDTLFPICLAAFLAMLLHTRSRHWSIVTQLLLLVFPGGYLVMDLAENALVAVIVTSDLSALRAEPVNRASGFTIAKFTLLAGTGVAILWAQMSGRSR